VAPDVDVEEEVKCLKAVSQRYHDFGIVQCRIDEETNQKES